MNKTLKILILGSNGLVGSTLLSKSREKGFTNICHPLRGELDLLKQQDVLEYFLKNEPDTVYLAAAKVGGIYANNTQKADFIFENLQIQQNVFNAAFKMRTKNLLFLGSSCIYPKNSPQPIREEYLLTSELEMTNEPYAIAKIAGLKTAQSFRQQYGLNWISVMPTNLYGKNDNFDLKNSHVIPGLIARMHLAKKNNDPIFKIWGSGKPKREFLYVDDMAEACIFLMNKDKTELPDYVNIGSGSEIEISKLAEMIAHKIDYRGKLEFDASMPDGTIRKLLDVSRMKSLGWTPKVDLENGLNIVIEHYISHKT